MPSLDEEGTVPRGGEAAGASNGGQLGSNTSRGCSGLWSGEGTRAGTREGREARRASSERDTHSTGAGPCKHLTGLALLQETSKLGESSQPPTSTFLRAKQDSSQVPALGRRSLESASPEGL